MAKRLLTLIIPLVILIIIISRYGYGHYLDYLVPAYLILHFLLVKSKIQFSMPPVVTVIVTGALAYVLFCEDCSALKKSTIFTLWMSYFSALVSNTLVGRTEGKAEL